MITPSSRLLLFTALLVVPFAAIGTMLPEYGLVSGVVLAGLVAVAALDALAATGTQAGIRVELPAVVRLSKDRDGRLDLRLHNERRQARRLRIGLPWPREIVVAGEDLVTDLPRGGTESRVAWDCSPRKRGSYRLDRCFVETSSPAGLWTYRAAQDVASELRVYPNLLTERKQVAALFLNRGSLGVHVQRQVGKGRDFEKLREYLPGDGYDEIHWKATAKRGRPVTKVFQMERTQEVYVIVDCSRLSAREVPMTGGPKPIGGGESGEASGGTVTTLERFLTASLVLGLAAERQGDLFGMLTFSDRVQSFVRAKNGKAHYAHCRDSIYALQPRIVSPDFEELATFIRLRLRRRALLVFLTALDDPLLAEQFTGAVQLLTRQHLVLVNMLPPPGVRPLFAGPEAANLDDAYAQLGGHLRWHDLRELEQTLKHRGVTLGLLENERLSAQLVSQYLNVKRRQLI